MKLVLVIFRHLQCEAGGFTSSADALAYSATFNAKPVVSQARQMHWHIFALMFAAIFIYVFGNHHESAM
jgi:hypothetical protein